MAMTRTLVRLVKFPVSAVGCDDFVRSGPGIFEIIARRPILVKVIYWFIAYRIFLPPMKNLRLLRLREFILLILAKLKSLVGICIVVLSRAVKCG